MRPVSPEAENSRRDNVFSNNSATMTDSNEVGG
jgi:hypothetical protein